MESIKDKVAVVGMGCCKFGENWDKDAQDMAVDACFEAFEDAGLEPKDIQAGYQALLHTGETGSLLSRWLKLEYVAVTRVENYCCGGLDSFRNACGRVERMLTERTRRAIRKSPHRDVRAVCRTLASWRDFWCLIWSVRACRGDYQLRDTILQYRRHDNIRIDDDLHCLLR